MHLKRYRSGTVRDALAQARAELGPEALVLSTRLVALRGVRGWLGAREVELTAAHDSMVSGSRPAVRSADMREEGESAAEGVWGLGARETRRPANRRSLGAGVDAGDDQGVAMGKSEGAKKDAALEAVIARLCATGLSRDLAERIAAGVPRPHRRSGSLAALEASTATELARLAAGDEGYAPVEVFVGPPGTGKTTTIAKIAAQERARRGARLNLLAADGFRVGAVEQLRLYADIIGTPFAVARTPAEIERSLLSTRGPVLVDTAGRSARDPRAQEVVAMLHGLPGVRTHLVLPAGAGRRDLRKLLDTYGDKTPSRVVLTRLDEADSVSPLVEVFEERGLKVSYLGTGQRVPEDLERATPQRLAAHVLGTGLCHDQRGAAESRAWASQGGRA